MKKQQLIETITSEILKSVSIKIREIVREEVDLERKRIRKQLLEEFRGNGHQSKSFSDPPRKTIDTGDRFVNSILDEIQTDMEDMVPEMRFADPESTIQDVSKQMINERQQPVRSDDQITKWSPEVAYKFNPAKHDPSQIDFSSIVDAMDNSSALPGDRK